MYLEALQRQMAVCSAEGAVRLTCLDQGYWNVVSIYGPRERKAGLPHAKTILYGCFDDVEEEHSSVHRSPRPEDVRQVFTFLKKLASASPPEPLIIHCQQGLSRSTALALSWIYSQLEPRENGWHEAVDLVLRLRPQAKPNRLVLFLGLSQLVPVEEARRLTDAILADPRLQSNRFLPSDTIISD